MDILKTFFSSDYDLLYDQLGTKGAVNQSIKSTKDSVTALYNEMSEIYDLVNELDGEYSEELLKAINTITDDIVDLVTTLSENYPKVETAMNELYDDLNEFKYQDQIYTLEHSNYEFACELQSNQSQYVIDEKTGEQTINSFWQQCEDDKNEAYENFTKAKEIIDALKIRIDENLKIIEEFNQSLSNIRIKVSAVVYSTNGVSLDEIKNMTTEEKEAYIQNLIDKLTEKYNYYVDQYKQIMSKYEEDNDYFLSQMALFNSLTGFNTQDFFLDLGGGTVKLAFTLSSFVDFILETKASNGKNAYECLQMYLDGASFKDSGLEELYINGGGLGYLIDYYEKGYLSDEEVESSWKKNIEYNCDIHNDETFEEFLQRQINDFYDLETDINNVKEYYSKAVTTGTSVMYYKELKQSVKYDDIREYINSGEYELKYTSSELKEYFQDQCYYEEADILKYLNEDETMTLTYIFETQGIDGVRDFIDSIEGKINRQKGYITAYNTYEQVMNGNPTVENIKMFFIGFGDGLVEYGDGLVDLVAPSNTISAEEYSKMYMLELFANDESFKSLMMQGAYQGGAQSSKLAISSLLNACTWGWGGTLTSAASAYGNRQEETLQHNSADEVVYSGNIDDFQAIDGGKEAALVALRLACKELFNLSKGIYVAMNSVN